MMVAISRQSDCANPTIWPNVQRTHTSISVQPTHQNSTDTYTKAKIQEIKFTTEQFLRLTKCPVMDKNSFDMFALLEPLGASLELYMLANSNSFSVNFNHLSIPILWQILRMEQLHKIVADLLCFFLSFLWKTWCDSVCIAVTLSHSLPSYGLQMYKVWSLAISWQGQQHLAGAK